MNGGLSPELKHLEEIRNIVRPADIPDHGLLCDLLWSDPDKDIEGWGENDRGVSYTFGLDKVEEFLQKHDLDLICRAHQLLEHVTFVDTPGVLSGEKQRTQRAYELACQDSGIWKSEQNGSEDSYIGSSGNLEEKKQPRTVTEAEHDKLGNDANWGMHKNTTGGSWGHGSGEETQGCSGLFRKHRVASLTGTTKFPNASIASGSSMQQVQRGIGTNTHSPSPQILAGSPSTSAVISCTTAKPPQESATGGLYLVSEHYFYSLYTGKTLGIILATA